MAIPYKVVIKGNKKDVNVVVTPSPVVTKEEYLKYVSKTVQETIMKANINKVNSFTARLELKRQLTEVLTYFHEQGMIKPKED